MHRVAFAVLVVACAVAPSLLADGPRFVRTVPVADQPVIEDTRTGYVWQGCAAGLTGTFCSPGSATTMDWQAALAYCEGLDWGGWTDWYLPNVLELTSIVHDARSSPCIDTYAFPRTPGESFWSSTPLSPSFAWIVWFGNGIVSRDTKTSGYYVRCVRRGP